MADNNKVTLFKLSKSLIAQSFAVVAKSVTWAAILAIPACAIKDMVHHHYKQARIERRAAFLEDMAFEAANPTRLVPARLTYRPGLAEGIGKSTKESFVAGENRSIPWGTVVEIATREKNFPTKGLVKARLTGPLGMDKDMNPVTFMVDAALLSPDKTGKPFNAIRKDCFATVQTKTVGRAFTYERLYYEPDRKEIGALPIPKDTAVEILYWEDWTNKDPFTSKVTVSLPDTLPGLTPGKKYIAIVTIADLKEAKEPKNVASSKKGTKQAKNLKERSSPVKKISPPAKQEKKDAPYKTSRPVRGTLAMKRSFTKGPRLS